MNTIKEDRWTIADIVCAYRPDGSGDITLPVSQRQWTWKGKRGDEKKQNLIDSVMTKFPIPTCILNRTGPVQFQIYDGRHRIETFYKYANDEFTWNEKKFSELSNIEKDKFNSREIPVTIISNASQNQLAEMFIRLNAGIPLKDYDLLWANRECHIVKTVEKLIQNNERLRKCLGFDRLDELKKREDLTNWAALVCGLSTRNAGNITTSYIRICSDIGLDHIPNEEYVKEGIDAICSVFEAANEQFPTENKNKRRLKKVGKVIAFFVDDWLKADNKLRIVVKWTDIIGRTRGADKDNMLGALTTTGAQNLTTDKIQKVLRQVDDYLERNIIHTSSSYSDDESQ